MIANSYDSEGRLIFQHFRDLRDLHSFAPLKKRTTIFHLEFWGFTILRYREIRVFTISRILQKLKQMVSEFHRLSRKCSKCYMPKIRIFENQDFRKSKLDEIWICVSFELDSYTKTQPNSELDSS